MYNDLSNQTTQPLEKQSTKKDSLSAEISPTGGLAALNLDDDSDMDMMLEIEDEAEIQQERISSDEDSLILCCCKKHERHDETMKFVCLYRKPEDWRVEIFKVDRKKGTLVDEDDNRKNVISHSVNKMQILGR